jgi:hypothetical protein
MAESAEQLLERMQRIAEAERTHVSRCSFGIACSLLMRSRCPLLHGARQEESLTYLDYAGAALPTRSQLQNVFQVKCSVGLR